MNNAKEDLLAAYYNSISNEDLIKECMAMGLETPDPNIPYHTYMMDIVANRFKKLIEENKKLQKALDEILIPSRGSGKTHYVQAKFDVIANEARKEFAERTKEIIDSLVDLMFDWMRYFIKRKVVFNIIYFIIIFFRSMFLKN